MKIKAKNLILDLLLAAEGQSLSAREAINACALFGISENNVRVVLVRLASEGLIEAADRGLYRLSAAAHELADEVATWRTAEQKVRPWSGGYLVVHSGPLGRTDRGALRKRNRALDMLGFRELDAGLYVRPDNIEASVDAVRDRLIGLGLEREAGVFVATQFDSKRETRIRTLWDGKALNVAYRKLRIQLEEWLARADALEPDVAARESFLLGGKAIRQVVFDPLLPEPMVDTKARHAFVETVRRYDRAGQRIWRQMGVLPSPSVRTSTTKAKLH
jgi:phenylacetic acid degradation operon negative regulatory protein